MAEWIGGNFEDGLVGEFVAIIESTAETRAVVAL